MTAQYVEIARLSAVIDRRYSREDRLLQRSPLQRGRAPREARARQGEAARKGGRGSFRHGLRITFVQSPFAGTQAISPSLSHGPSPPTDDDFSASMMASNAQSCSGSMSTNHSYRALLALPFTGRLLAGMQIARIGQSMVSVTIVLFTLASYRSPMLAGLAT